MKNKIYWMLALCVLVFASTAPAYSQPDPKKAAEKQIEWLKKNFTLSADQLQKVTDLHNLYSEKSAKAMEGASFPPSKQLRAEMDKLHTEKEGELRKILTAEQLTKFEKIKGDYKKAGRPR